MTAIINILMCVFMVIGVFKGSLSIITSILCFIASVLCFVTSIACFSKNLSKDGKSANPKQRQKANNILIINGLSISVVSIIAISNIAIHYLKILIALFILGFILSFVSKLSKKFKKPASDGKNTSDKEEKEVIETEPLDIKDC